ncbi:MAG: MerR family transcriptional regulator [Eubacteriales bacterium]|nr:MerR family transcriptional regulator [Eubacteriales bacterium]MDD4390851.1 MerR family transcriptional regulator [Eubacteriales bacterium]
MPKSEGLFSIGEMAAVCGVSIDTLRFYETKALITPAHVDPESGYRYYRRENLLRLRTMLALKDAGLSLSEIRDYMVEGKHTENKIAELTERRDLLNQAIENLQIRGVKPGDLTVSEIELPERLCLCRMVEARDGAAALREIGKFYDELIRSGVPISRAWPEFCEYPDDGLLRGEFPVTDFIVTACLPVDKKNAPPEAVRYPSGTAVTVNYRGGYYDLWKAYEALSRYIDENGYVPAGYPQEIYLEIEADGSVRLDEARNVTRVIVPVKLMNG